MNASALPDPQVVSYDLLLSYVAISFFTHQSNLRVDPHRHILSYLNLYGTSIPMNVEQGTLSYRSTFTVEADYTVVFFAAGSKYTPSWNWIWKAYRSLSRKYRKNLKQLVGNLKAGSEKFTHVASLNKYIIHSSFFSKSQISRSFFSR